MFINISRIWLVILWGLLKIASTFFLHKGYRVFVVLLDSRVRGKDNRSAFWYEAPKSKLNLKLSFWINRSPLWVCDLWPVEFWQKVVVHRMWIFSQIHGLCNGYQKSLLWICLCIKHYESCTECSKFLG